LFDIMFSTYEFEGANTQSEEMVKQDLMIEHYELEHISSQFDMNIFCTPANEKIYFTCEYSTDIFTETSINRFFEFKKQLIENIIDNSGKQLEDIEIITKEEKVKLLKDYNQTNVQFEGNKSVQSYLFEQAKLNPNKIAVIEGGREISYKDLLSSALYYTRILKEKGISEGDLVGIIGQRSVEMMVGIYAIMCSGAAYVPIDANNPENKNKRVIEESNIKVLLSTDSNYSEPYSTIVHPEIITYSKELTSESGIDVKQIEVTDDSIVYVIYTSGSTGQPKGVPISQKGLLNYLLWADKEYNRNDNINWPLYTSISFDLTVTSLFLPLLNGSSVVIYNGEIHDVLTTILDDAKVQAIKATPAHLKLLKELKRDDNKQSIVKRMVIGGEALEASLCKEIENYLGSDIEIYNEYGPTETVVGCIVHKYDNTLNYPGNNVFIGKPIANTQIFICNDRMTLQPIGVEGEICIAGTQLAKGYLNNEELTKKIFVQADLDGGRTVYRTGDKAIYLENGNILYTGRTDDMIKIRGYRIELGEIEYHLTNIDGIERAVLLVNKDNGDSRIFAYLIASESLELHTIKTELEKVLPKYMVPEQFFMVDNIPVTPNGKVDKKVLLKQKQALRTSEDLVKPGTEYEMKIAEIWSDILKNQEIGIHDNFFDVGGNSFNIIQVNHRMNEAFSLEIPIVDLFTYTTIFNASKLVSEMLSNDTKSDMDKDQQGFDSIDKAKERRRSRKRMEIIDNE